MPEIENTQASNQTETTGVAGGGLADGTGGRGRNSTPNSRPSSRSDNRKNSKINVNDNNKRGGKGRVSQDTRDASRGRRRPSKSSGSDLRKGGGGVQQDRKATDSIGTAGEDRIRQVIGELKAMPAPTNTTSEVSPDQAPNKRLPVNHRKNLSRDNSAGIGSKSTLNPHAGGFQPGAFGAISDAHAEALRAMASDQPSMPGQKQVGPDQLAVLSAAAVISPNTGYPLTGQSALFENNFSGMGTGWSEMQVAQALEVARLQAQLAALQTGGQIHPRFVGADSFAGSDVGAAMAGVLPEHRAAESLQIQETLKYLAEKQGALAEQQQLLEQRHVELLSDQNNMAISPVSFSHRRGQSAQVGGASGMMGTFAVDVPTVSDVAKGHGRRHSVQVDQKFVAPSNNIPLSGVSLVGDGDLYAAGNKRHRRARSTMSGFGGPSLDMGAIHGPVELGHALEQLQLLKDFRDVTNQTSHGKMASISQSMIIPNSRSFTQDFMSSAQGNFDKQQQRREQRFAEHLTMACILPLLAAGKLVSGTLRINQRNRSDAYVTSAAVTQDIYIGGSKDRNRALEGDIVAVQLLDVESVMGQKKNKEERKRKKIGFQSYDPKAQQDLQREDKKRDDVEVEGQSLLLCDEEHHNDAQRPAYAGHIVGIIEHPAGQVYSGTLCKFRPSSAATKEKQEAERTQRVQRDSVSSISAQQRDGKKQRELQAQPDEQPQGHKQDDNSKPLTIVWFRPTDKRVPLTAIPVKHAPADYLADPDKYPSASTLFMAALTRWPTTSLHPFGMITEKVGTIGDVGAETTALLRECGFAAETFSDTVLRSVPPTPWTIPDKEYDTRRDFRGELVFTIDPQTAKELDDALHIHKNDDGTFDVGIHIADVTYFVQPGSAVDREAQHRAITVDLVQRALPMLPPTLAEELCSLLPGQDRLTFSIVFKMSPEGLILSTWFGKSIIRSAAKLTYTQAQSMIDGNPSSSVELQKPDYTLQNLKDSIGRLNTIAQHLRGGRIHNGCLRIEKAKLNFTLDDDALPVDCAVFNRNEAHELIEEFMLQANVAVAKKIATGLPEQALLRSHEPSDDRRLERLVDNAKRLGFDIDTSSSRALRRTLNNLKTESQASNLAAQFMVMKSMSRANYICAGAVDFGHWKHFARNLPIYTHFTSPLCRYSDVTVHRQLEAVLVSSFNPSVKYSVDTEIVSMMAKQCNAKKAAACLAEERSQHLFLCILIADLTQKYGPVVRNATVVGVLDEAFDVIVTDFAIEKRVHIDQLPIHNHGFDEHSNTLKLYWKQGVDVITHIAEQCSDDEQPHLPHSMSEIPGSLEASSRSVHAENELFEDGEDDDCVVHPRHGHHNGQSIDSVQRNKSMEATTQKPNFESIESIDAGPNVVHYVQTIKELQIVPVIIVADTTKSPPVIKVFAVNPFA